jgi:hypothetical protein
MLRCHQARRPEGAAHALTLETTRPHMLHARSLAHAVGQVNAEVVLIGPETTGAGSLDYSLYCPGPPAAFRRPSRSPQ